MEKIKLRKVAGLGRLDTCFCFPINIIPVVLGRKGKNETSIYTLVGFAQRPNSKCSLWTLETKMSHLNGASTLEKGQRRV